MACQIRSTDKSFLTHLTHKRMVTCKSKQNLSLRWRHNRRDSVSNHQLHDCLLNRLFRRRSKKTPKLRVTGLCVGNSPGTCEFPAQMASNAENVSIWWGHHIRVMSHGCYGISQITRSSTVCSSACSGWYQRTHQRSALVILCEGNSPVTDGFPSEMVSNMERVVVTSSLVERTMIFSTICASTSTHWGLNKMANISQTIFSNASAWKKDFVFWLKFNWIFFPRSRSTTGCHCFSHGLAPNNEASVN